MTDTAALIPLIEERIAHLESVYRAGKFVLHGDEVPFDDVFTLLAFVRCRFEKAKKSFFFHHGSGGHAILRTEAEEEIRECAKALGLAVET